MRRIKLVRDEYELSGIMVEDEEVLRILTSRIGVRIMRILSRKPSYAAEVAERLGTSKQLVSNHIRRMYGAGLLVKDSEVDVRGGRAVLYRASAQAVAVAIDRSGWVRRSSLTTMPEHLAKFLSPMVEGGELRGLVVVGSPHPHGPLQSVAADGHYGFQLGLFLGRYVRLRSQA
ncbi:MAG: winged helix-turn-helix domain-containing protein [Nitrososphaerota archaeon]